MPGGGLLLISKSYTLVLTIYFLLMAYSIIALVNTYLKQDTVQSVKLSDTDRYAINKGWTFPISWFVDAPSQHIKITLGKESGKQLSVNGKNTWYAFAPHVQILQDGKPFVKANVVSPGRMGENGLELLKAFEGCVLHAYQDSVGVWTIGYGSTVGVLPGDVIRSQDAENLLKQDLDRFERAVSWQITSYLNQDQFDALVSFAFNVGEYALEQSTLRWKLNQGDYSGAADEFLKWDRAGGEQLPGLTRRRQAERALFLSQDWRSFL